MSAYLDSSVIVSAVVEEEQWHETCAGILLGPEPLQLRPHTYAEAFSTMTGGRLGRPLSAEVALKLLKVNILPRVEPVDLSDHEVLRALDEAEARGVRGGAVHDYLHLTAARKARAARLYTLNLSDFIAFRRPGDPEIVHPGRAA
jgi:predicted nucleic acid-binding protein